jgi:phytoene desaturase
MEFNTGRPKVLVIGAGIGGITTAALLARHGYEVTVAEKCQRPGGRCGRMVVNGYHFDTGATLFLMPELYAQTFTALGECMEDHLDLRRIDPTYHLYFKDDSTLHLTSNLSAMQAQLEGIEPGSFGQFLSYIREGHRHYELSLHHLVTRDFRSLPEFLNLKNLLLFLRLESFTIHTNYVDRYFKDPRLKIAFTFQDLYMGLSPFEAPATYSFMQYTELADGVWFPMGGMYRVIEALTDIAEKLGVRFLFNAPVERILVDDRHATGIVLADGRDFRADVLVANADLGYVYQHLLPEDGMTNSIERKEYGCSTVMFYWGLDKQYPDLATHNLFLNGDYRQGFDAIFKNLTMPDEPNFYIHAPVRVDPSLAPIGHDTLVVAIPVGHINDENPQDWSVIKSRARKFVLQRLTQVGLSDLESHIKFEVSGAPDDWQNRYNLSRGSTHGLSHKLTQMGYLRPHNRHHLYRNLYFVGASTHPGTGMPTVLVSARLVAERVLQDMGN